MRDTNELKKAIKTAEEAVEDMHDPILKTAAFQTILKELLPKQKEETNQSEQKFSSFSQGNVNVNQTMPLEVFQTTSDGFKIIANFGKDVGKSKQIQYVLLYLYANKLQTGQRVCLSKIVQKAMKTCGFGELPNLNAYLRAVPNLVIVAVKKEKAKNTYELTDIGLNVASQLINEIKESFFNFCIFSPFKFNIIEITIYNKI